MENSALVASRVFHRLIGYELTELVKQSNLSEDVTLTTLGTLLKEGCICKVGVWWFARSNWHELCTQTIELLREQHRQYPLRNGLSPEVWRTRLGLTQSMATDVLLALQEEGVLTQVSSSSGTREAVRPGNLLRLPDFTPTLSAEEQKQLGQVLHAFRQQPYTPPV